MKYMVMECHLSYAVVLSEDGRFIKVANRNYSTGQTVTDIVEMQLPQTGKNTKWLKALTAVAACFVIMASALLYSLNSTYASVYMSINPQVRIDVNRNDKVVAVEGINADGAQLVQQYTHGRKPLDQVMDELVDLAIDKGYLHQGGKIAVSLEADAEWVNSHSTTIQQQLDTHLKEKLSVTIEVNGGTAGQIIIPADPEYSDYGDSGYGVSDYGTGDSGYGDSDYGVTDYSTAEGASDYGVSDYGVTDYGTAEGESVYYGGATDYGNSDYGTETASDNEAESDYDTESVSDYDDDGDSDYDD